MSVCLLSSIGSVVTVSAQGSDATESITISPTSRKVQLDGGKDHNDTLKIINSGKTAYDFIVYARPYSVKSDSYEPNFNSTPKNADLYSWVQFSETKYRIEPGGSMDVKYTIRVPTGATPGGHYGVIFAETQPAGSAPANSVVRKKRVGMVLYATVNGVYKNEGTADPVDIPFWQVEPPLKLSTKAKNTGNTDFTDQTHLVIRDIFGGIKHDAKKDFIVLPETTRKINLAWEQSHWFGLYKVDVEQIVLGKPTLSSGYVLMMPRYVPIALLIIALMGGIYAVYRHKTR